MNLQIKLTVLNRKTFQAHEGDRKLGIISQHGRDSGRWRHALSGQSSFPNPVWAAAHLASVTR